MKTQRSRLAIAITAAAIIPGIAWAQHEGHHAAGTQTPNPDLTRCLRAQPAIQNIIGNATARAETARLSNSPSELRAAIDHLEAALRDIRVQSEPCAAVSVSDSHAAHTMAPAPPAATGDAANIEAWLKGYDVAFNAKDLDRLATFYHQDVTIYEGGGINNGWLDYRDHHLGPELNAFENLQFGHSSTKVTMLPGGRSAYATSEYSIKARMGEREIDSRGLETLVLLKGVDGSWKIGHSHTSSKPARRPPA